LNDDDKHELEQVSKGRSNQGTRLPNSAGYGPSAANGGW
jgi:hypothetical protein